MALKNDILQIVYMKTRVTVMMILITYMMRKDQDQDENEIIP